MTRRQILMIVVPCEGFHYVKGRAPHFDESLAPIGSAYAVIDTSHHSERLTPSPTMLNSGRAANKSILSFKGRLIRKAI